MPSNSDGEVGGDVDPEQILLHRLSELRQRVESADQLLWTREKSWKIGGKTPHFPFRIVGYITAAILIAMFSIWCYCYNDDSDDFSQQPLECILRNSQLLMEMTRPEMNCDFCRGVREIAVHDGRRLGAEDFVGIAYADKPFVIRGATSHWDAFETFSFEYFRKLFNETREAYWDVETQCQFFPYKTEFESLREAFSMPKSRADMSGPDARTWYIGWSNCNFDVAKELRRHYSRPHFFPNDSEMSAIDWIFMGHTGQGAGKHIDYVKRPSWQAQIKGRKTWTLYPPPECESVCSSMKITVAPGDLIFINTNIWYHETFIEPGSISITIGSEYD